MKMNKGRILSWIICLALATVFYYGESFIEPIQTILSAQKTEITIQAPKNMEKAFKKALSVSNLPSSQYTIVMTNDKNADITVEYGKENDESYTKFAFSPFVIAYSDDYDCFQDLKNAGTLIQNEFDNKFYELDFFKVMDEVIEEGQWKNLGLNSENKIHLFYPAESTVYWHDFYHFMLLTANNGSYPKTEKDMVRAIQKVNRFMESSCTEAVTNFDEKIDRANGFNENTFYIIPENIVYQLALDHYQDARLLFPLVTVHFNYYAKGNSEVGRSIISSFNTKFYDKLQRADYRSEYSYHFTSCHSYASVKDVRDTYQTAEIPKENFFTQNYWEEE